ncbi:hypothetical protein EXIGLDRAFT_676314 [Exidia glandulosa HHB12029]|uniref:Methyltransferase domain-containing protein n=1 Tax=Exidia glandulosa HHB12029 TaxID=1314781 RepID=A0A165GZU0_EXIGL|nr:hypothetical protein EXIGLDRAFT_676314 [Exidia glandulosa HHB12029]
MSRDAWWAAQRSAVLDPSILSLDEDETAFFKSYTGITDNEELRQHILDIQRKAYEVYPYPCIRLFAFTMLKISRFSAYQQVLQLGRERPGAVLLDLGCCLGNDARKVVADGFPATQVIACDLHADFWKLGYELFRDDVERCKIRFVQGDVFSDTFIAPNRSTESIPSGSPIEASVENGSLIPLQGRVSAIHISAFFHLFNEAQQLEIARRCVALLSAERGSVIFGSHGGAVDAGPIVQRDAYAHNPETFKKMWVKAFEGRSGTVQVDVELMNLEPKRVGAPERLESVKREGITYMYSRQWLVWAVRRI